MPSRNRSREARKAAAKRDASGSEPPERAQSKPSKAKPSKAKSSRAKPSKAKGRKPKVAVDPSDVADVQVRFIQPYEASKTYRCPGCGRDIQPGQGHLVAVPPDDPDLRRHWHRGCWNNRRSRR